MAKSKGMRITGTIIKIVLVMAVLAVNFTLFWKMCSMKMPESIRMLIPNDKLFEQYQKDGDKIEIFTQDYEVFTKAKRNYGYFAIIDAVFIPSINQVQLVFRYNKSTLEKLATDYNLDEIPSRDEQLYDVTLVRMVDITPDDLEDNKIGEGFSKERIKPSAVRSEQKGMHNYYRYVFDNVTTEDAAGIFADIYYVNELDYDKLAYGSVLIYDAEKNNIAVKLDKATKEALKNNK